MSGETSESISGWTTDTLHGHVDVQFRLLREQIDRQWADERRATDIALRAHDEALKVAAVTSKEAITAALAAQKEAVGIAQTFADQRAAGMNEWRSSLNDVLTKAMPRLEAEAAIQRATERIQEIVLAQAGMVTRAEYDALAKQVAQMQATAAGASDKVKGVYAALGVGVSLIIVAIAVFNFLAAR